MPLMSKRCTFKFSKLKNTLATSSAILACLENKLVNSESNLVNIAPSIGAQAEGNSRLGPHNNRRRRMHDQLQHGICLRV